MELELKWLRFKRETDYFGGERREANYPGGARAVFEGPRSYEFPHFMTERSTLY